MMLIFLFLSSSIISLSRGDTDDVVNRLKQQRLRYQQSLALIKKGYEILSQLESEFFVDSSDFFKALDYFQLKKYNRCVPIFISLIKKDERKLESTYLLAESFYFQKKIKEASVIYNSIIKSRPAFFDDTVTKIFKYSYLRLIDCFSSLGQKKDVCSVIQDYIDIFPEEKNNPQIQLLCRQNDCMSILESDEREGATIESKPEDAVTFVVRKRDSSNKG